MDRYVSSSIVLYRPIWSIMIMQIIEAGVTLFGSTSESGAPVSRLLGNYSILINSVSACGALLKKKIQNLYS